MKAKRKELKEFDVSEFLNTNPKVITLKAFVPEKKKGGIVLEGAPDEIADKLINILKEKAII